MNGRVLKVLSDKFAVCLPGETVVVKSRKKLKREVLPVAGDLVELDKCGDEYVLTGIMPRNNRIIRPPVANVDRIIITVAPLPETDFLAVDKMIINAHKFGISTVICLNKTDILQDGLYDKVVREYSGIVDNIVCTCSANRDVAAVRDLLNGGFTCFAGQSAVGKTSLINAICGLNREVGDLSEKTLRGKNTTVGVELIKLGEDTYIADTPGFGALDLDDINSADLHLYYSEYVKVSGGCKYHMCTHTTEPDCAVKTAVGRAELNKARHERYLTIFEELKKKNTYTKLRRNLYGNK